MKIAVTRYCIHARILWRLAVILCLSFAANAQAKVPDEYDVKLVYLYNFTKFISWPEQAFNGSADPFVICVAGREFSRESIQALENKQTRNRAIVIKRVTGHSPLNNCHILFLTKSVKPSVFSQMTENLQSKVLIVGETDEFAKQHGDIGFLIDERNRIRIEINLDRTNQKNISIRAQLLEIARAIYQAEEPQ